MCCKVLDQTCYELPFMTAVVHRRSQILQVNPGIVSWHRIDYTFPEHCLAAIHYHVRSLTAAMPYTNTALHSIISSPSTRM
jgi:hypothetical protein